MNVTKIVISGYVFKSYAVEKANYIPLHMDKIWIWMTLARVSVGDDKSTEEFVKRGVNINYSTFG